MSSRFYQYYSLSTAIPGTYSNIFGGGIFEEEFNLESMFDDFPVSKLDTLNLIADIKANALDKVTVNMSCDNLSDLSTAMTDLDNALVDGDITAIENCLKTINGNIISGLYLKGYKEKVATVELDYFKDEDDFADNSIFVVEPIIIISQDQSSYRFKEFFSEDSFRKIIDTYHKLVDDFSQKFSIE